MKISKISFTNSNYKNTNGLTINPYMYTQPKEKEDRFTFKDHKLEYLGGILAGALALISLSKFSAAKTLPKSIIEIEGLNNGLNKIADNSFAVKVLKENILYPLKSVELGEHHLLKRNDFKTGVIISSKDAQKAQRIKDALMEHLDKLGFKVYSINDTDKIKTTNKVARAHKTVNKANEMFQENTYISIADIDDLSKITNLKANKTKCSSKLEKKLIDQNPGTLWVSWTDQVDNIPYFYNNKSTLCIRID